MKRYLDSTLSPEERAEDLLSQMSLEEKMGQVRCLFPFGGSDGDLDKNAAHGIGEVSTLDLREFTCLEDVVAWQRSLQTRIMGHSEHHIPAIFHMEGLCGAFLPGATAFPSGIARGAGFDPELEIKIGRTVARQELSCGINRILAPVLDVARDSRLGRYGESYGEDPTLAASLGSAYTKGVQMAEVEGRRAESMAKHFVGFHASAAGIHGAHSEVPERPLREIFGKPFQASISVSSLRGVMPCYCSINGEALSASKHYLTEMLREEMGFDGVVGSDYGALGNLYEVQGLGESLEDVGQLAIESGMDAEYPNTAAYNDNLLERFRNGNADVRILDQAVLRILRAKFRMGLFEHPFAVENLRNAKELSSEEGRKLSLQSALKSLVLLKNNGVLPLSPDLHRIAVIGPHANNARFFFGAYTHLSMVEAVHAVANSLAGVGQSALSPCAAQLIPGTQIQSDESEVLDDILRQFHSDSRSLLEELSCALPQTEIRYAYGYPIAGNDHSHFREALEIADKADLVLLTLGGKYGSCSVASMGEGVDSTEIGLPECQEAFVIEASKLGKPLIGIHFDGRPVSSDIADNCLDALLEAWSPAEAGAEAVVKTLLGSHNTAGRLPVSVPRSAGQIPIYYNHPNGSAWHQGRSIGFQNYVNMPHTPRYCFGFGLSYTSFRYSDLTLSKREIGPAEGLTICFLLQNVGHVDGEEVVQLYIKDMQASMVRPVQELAGFRRVFLKAGETKRISFELQANELAFLDREMRWKVEKGLFTLRIAASSEDVRLSETFAVTEDAWIDGSKRTFYAESSEELLSKDTNQ